MNTTSTLTDDELIARVSKNCASSARLLADLLVDLIDIEDRGVHLREASSSMFEFCKRRFRMSPSQAWRRTAAARLVRRLPSLLPYVRAGEVDLSTLLLLRNIIDADNADELIRATRCRSKRQIERYLDARDPQRRGKKASAGAAREKQRGVVERLEAMGDELHLLEVAVSDKTRILFERARHLLADAMPNATFADLIQRALETLVDTLEEALRSARSKRGARRSPVKAGYIPRAVRYAIFVRDGFRCTFVNASSERCGATQCLEIDHIIPRAHGGSDEFENLRCVCRAHNLYFAEERFGRRFIRSRIRTRQTSPPPMAARRARAA